MFSDVDYRPAFIQGGRGRLFTFGCWPAQGDAVRRGVLLLPPFAEEMNKSRRMLTQQAKLLARQGYATLLLDLFGTGDSEGDFRDASWSGWVEDVCCATRCLMEQGVEEVSFIALRSGALLLSGVLDRCPSRGGKLVLWQPVISGELFLNQFFRLRIAAEMTHEPQDKVSVIEIRRELQQTGHTEIGGYMLSQALAEQLAAQQLQSLAARYRGGLHWCEIVPSDERPVAAAARNGIDQLAGAGLSVYLHKVHGHPFWGAAGDEDVPALLETTCRIFAE